MPPPDDPPPLTPAQQALVGDVVKLAGWFARRTLSETLRFYGREDVYQEMMLAACAAARTYDPALNVEFKTYAYRAMWMRRNGLTRSFGVRGSFWYEWPTSGDPSVGALEVADERPAPRPSPLSVWCATAPARAGVHPRHRLVLYVRCVEGWSLEEAASYFGVSVKRVQQMCAAAREIVGRRKHLFP